MNIYLSNLIISTITAIVCQSIYILIIILFGRPIFGNLHMSAYQFTITMINTILVMILYTSIFNMVTMLSSEITISTIVCMLLFITMFVIDSAFSTAIYTPKYIENVYVDKNGEEHVTKTNELNPNYPGEFKQAVAKIICFSIPVGQASELQNIKSKYLETLPIYSIIVICLINVSGIYIFNRKELK